LIFVAFDAEEMGLQGSKYFVAHPPISIKNILININMDMIAHNDKNELYACGTYHFPELKQFVFSKNKAPIILFGHDDPKLGHDDWTFQSDQGSFFEKKIPFLYFGVEDHKDYHKETDEYKNINEVFYLKSVAAILEIINHLDQNTNLQSIMKSNQIMN
jgi:Zn-dependent M28 family amino/carboxypeptidase